VSRGSAAPRRRTDLFDDEFQRKLDYLAIVSRRVFAGRHARRAPHEEVGSGVEFADHRDYTAGDDFRYLDWNVYQRFGRLLIRSTKKKRTSASTSSSTLLRESMAFGDGEKLQARSAWPRRSPTWASPTSTASPSWTATDEIAGACPPTRGKGRIFKVFASCGDPTDGQTDLGDA
jgi:hypothetical protein